MSPSSSDARPPAAGQAPPEYRTPAAAGSSEAGSEAGSGAESEPGRRRSSTGENGRSRRLTYPPAPEPLPLPVMDNHTHLDFHDGLVEVDPAAALDAAERVGVAGAVQVGCDLESSRFTVAAIERDPRLLGAVAIHPNEAVRYAARGELDAALAEIEALAAHPRVRAIGETGLDYFRTPREDAGPQHTSFRRHLDLACRLGKALQIHDRDAHDDVVAILRSAPEPPAVVFHSFSGDGELARLCNDRGWYMSFSGTVSFGNADAQREALRVARPELLLVETDAPFLTPHPHRGRPNASYLVPYTVRSMATTRGTELAELCAVLRENTERVYGTWAADEDASPAVPAT
ncbi:TatD family hydrolase [Tersicoccus sp. Bi-70]|uniref:TatD family hydrolase n=1 Tax=Tersicoccus sp. Bi-70 TaxID=1897634 RepID=UPI000977DC02|nr:TatD family hydrolase [Tersicoccus sp. Bi-70]OMH31391.1 deoxyribonuclease [Tersicoccus sp. Bi-70]